GLLRRVVIDQHFTQRNRLGRLLSIIAENPFVLGIGIDEDTAIIVDRDTNLEVVGTHTVTIVDGRNMHSTINEIPAGQILALTNVTLNVLPAGHRYNIETRTPLAPAPKREIVGTPESIPAAES